jgi:Protein of unknown function (DUF2924)
VARVGSLAQQGIADLAALSTDELRQRWAEFYRVTPTSRISRDVLVRGVAFRLQEDAHGGLGKSCRRQLRRLAETLRDEGAIPAAQGQTFKLGTKLIREWKGKVHEVVIAGDGYEWGGKRYRSLSQVARSITGTRWSGPRFFGLATEKQAAVSMATAGDGDG